MPPRLNPSHRDRFNPLDRAQVPTGALGRQDVTMKARLVFAGLHLLADHGRVLWRVPERMAATMGVSRRTLYRARCELIDAGFIGADRETLYLFPGPDITPTPFPGADTMAPTVEVQNSVIGYAELPPGTRVLYYLLTALARGHDGRAFLWWGSIDDLGRIIDRDPSVAGKWRKRLIAHGLVDYDRHTGNPETLHRIIAR